MANTKSIKKVLRFLQTRKTAVSPSEICANVMLRYKTVREIVEILKMNNQVLILTARKGNTLVQLKSGDKNAT